MSKAYRRVGDPMTKRWAVIRMLSEPGTKIAHFGWPKGEFIVLDGSEIRTRTGMCSISMSVEYDALEWYIVEEVETVVELPERAALRRAIEEAEALAAGARAKIAEAKAKLEALP